METSTTNWFNEISIPFLQALVICILFFITARKVKSKLSAWLEGQQLQLGARILRRIKWPLRAAGLALGAQVFIWSASDQNISLGKFIVVPQILLVLTLMWLVDVLLDAFLTFKLNNGVTVSTRVLIKSLARIAIGSVAALVILERIGVSVTPLLASLGVGSLAVALALQDTLGNMFSGFYLLADRPIRIGDFIRLENGTEGFVERVGWRTTHILLPGQSMAVVPNSKIASAQIINFDLPNSEINVTVDVGIDYQTPLDQAETILTEIARKVTAQSQATIKETSPVVRFKNFGDSAIVVGVTIRARHFEQVALARHDLIKALHAGLKDAKIGIPYPQRVIHQGL
ncbi:MAG: mechanosensitive ion channel family protein [Oligoflexia bacterium]|nr:mechanosensitive ion channel family protein [Oligoflexia bacterium]